MTSSSAEQNFELEKLSDGLLRLMQNLNDCVSACGAKEFRVLWRTSLVSNHVSQYVTVSQHRSGCLFRHSYQNMDFKLPRALCPAGVSAHGGCDSGPVLDEQV